MMMIQLLVVRENYMNRNNIFVFILKLEIDDGEDENIEHEDDFLEKLKGKVGGDVLF